MKLLQRMRYTLLALPLVLVTLIAGGTTAEAVENRTSYIVRVSPDSIGLLNDTLRARSVIADQTYESVFLGVSARLSTADLAAIRVALPQAVVEADSVVSLETVQTGLDGSNWALDSVDQSATSPSRDAQYVYPAGAGSGVDVFVIDTGLQPNTYSTGGELAGRVDTTRARNFVTPVESSYTATTTRECLSGTNSINGSGGHGTHVAGIIASATFGVAKSATIIPLRVFACSGQATASAVINALDYVVQEHIRTQRPSVANLSLGASCDYVNCASDSLVTAVKSAVSHGVVVVSAAGNGDANNGNTPLPSCNVSPGAAAGSSAAITVAALDSTDAITSFSNNGACISILAPGLSVKSLNAWYGNDENGQPLSNMGEALFAYNSGTSMASPFVAGAAALYLGTHSQASPAEVKSALAVNARLSVKTMPASTTSNVLSTAFLLDTLGTATATVTKRAVTSLSFAWSAVAGASTYSYRYRKVGAENWTQVNGITTPSATVSGLTNGVQFEFAIAPVAGSQMGVFPTPTSATTLTGVTSAVRSLRSTYTSRSYVKLAWTAPSAANGASIKDYYIYVCKYPSKTKCTRFKDGASTKRYVTVTGLRPGTRYYFKVYAKTVYGLSPEKQILLRTRY